MKERHWGTRWYWLMLSLGEVGFPTAFFVSEGKLRVKEKEEAESEQQN